jgi:hypothetical protein
LQAPAPRNLDAVKAQIEEKMNSHETLGERRGKNCCRDCHRHVGGRVRCRSEEMGRNSKGFALDAALHRTHLPADAGVAAIPARLPNITSNWASKRDKRGTVPVGPGIGKAFKIGAQPMTLNLKTSSPSDALLQRLYEPVCCMRVAAASPAIVLLLPRTIVRPV